MDGAVPLPPSGAGLIEHHGIARSNLTKIDYRGVLLYVDHRDEDYYLDITPDHDPQAREIVLAHLPGLGLELMPADECEPDVLEDGTVRHYLAEVIHC